jgi:hypothetical protein
MATLIERTTTPVHPYAGFDKWRVAHRPPRPGTERHQPVHGRDTGRDRHCRSERPRRGLPGRSTSAACLGGDAPGRYPRKGVPCLPQAGGCCRCDQSLELAAASQREIGDPGSGGRQPSCAEARKRHAGDGWDADGQTPGGSRIGAPDQPDTVIGPLINR